jgi:thymidylate synthase
MHNLHDLYRNVLENGTDRGDRTGTGTRALFEQQLRFDLRNGFPAVTTKKLFFKGVLHELIWFLKGSTNIKYLVDNDIHIWDDWPYQAYNKLNPNKLTQKEFITKIKSLPTDDNFVTTYGELGCGTYGDSWRNWNNTGKDQLSEMIETLKTNPNSRRIMVTAWNPELVPKMKLPPCHYSYQAFSEVIDGERHLSLSFNMRSVDCFLGMPFDIASYAILTHMIAQASNHKVKELVCKFGDTHIYNNHFDQVKEQLSREPYELPTLELNPNITNIDNFEFDDVKLLNYQSHPSIKAPIAV